MPLGLVRGVPWQQCRSSGNGGLANKGRRGSPFGLLGFEAEGVAATWGLVHTLPKPAALRDALLVQVSAQFVGAQSSQSQKCLLGISRRHFHDAEAFVVKAGRTCSVDQHVLLVWAPNPSHALWGRVRRVVSPSASSVAPQLMCQASVGISEVSSGSLSGQPMLRAPGRLRQPLFRAGRCCYVLGVFPGNLCIDELDTWILLLVGD